MTIAIVDQPSPTRQRPPRGTRPARRPPSARGPLVRPMPPGGSRGAGPPWSNTVRACRMDPVTLPSASWRLTDRGIALVLVLAAMIVMAAVTVIGLTAWRVTGPDYQASESSQLSQR